MLISIFGLRLNIWKVFLAVAVRAVACRGPGYFVSVSAMLVGGYVTFRVILSNSRAVHRAAEWCVAAAKIACLAALLFG